MNTWGAGAFDNDDAAAWARLLTDTHDLALVEAAFLAVEESDLLLSAHDAAVALAACEVLARLHGNSGNRNKHTALIDEWVLNHPQPLSDELLAHADWMMKIILGPQSELRERWEKTDATPWLRAVEDLRNRLKNSGAERT